MLMGGDTTRNM